MVEKVSAILKFRKNFYLKGVAENFIFFSGHQ